MTVRRRARGVVDPRLGRLQVLAWRREGHPPAGRCTSPCTNSPESNLACGTCGKYPGEGPPPCRASVVPVKNHKT